MYKIAICDDNEICCKMNLDLIKKYKEDHTCAITTDVFERGKDLVRSNLVYDIVILDIDMPELNGMEVAATLREKGYEGYIIFITSHTSPVYESFKYNAFRYLVKPVKENQLFEGLTSIFKEIEDKNDQYLVAKVDSKNIVRIDINDIKYIETLNRKTIFHLSKRNVETIMRMNELESNLTSYHFFRPHKSYLLNMKYVQSYDKSNVEMVDDTLVPMSRLKLSAFKKAFHEYIKG